MIAICLEPAGCHIVHLGGSGFLLSSSLNCQRTCTQNPGMSCQIQKTTQPQVHFICSNLLYSRKPKQTMYTIVQPKLCLQIWAIQIHKIQIHKIQIQIRCKSNEEMREGSSSTAASSHKPYSGVLWCALVCAGVNNISSSTQTLLWQIYIL